MNKTAYHEKNIAEAWKNAINEAGKNSAGTDWVVLIRDATAPIDKTLVDTVADRIDWKAVAALGHYPPGFLKDHMHRIDPALFLMHHTLADVPPECQTKELIRLAIQKNPQNIESVFYEEDYEAASNYLKTGQWIDRTPAGGLHYADDSDIMEEKLPERKWVDRMPDGLEHYGDDEISL